MAAETPSPVCILAGGYATRLGPLSRATPKALVEVAGRPFVFHQLDMLSAEGVERVVFCVAWLGTQIEEVVTDRYGPIEIAYSYDGERPAGTLTAIRSALPLLGERFLVLYGDTLLTIDLATFERGWRASGLPAAMAVLHNQGRWGISNAVYVSSRVARYEKRHPDAAMQWIDYGIGGLTAAALGSAGEASDLADLYRSLAEGGELYGFEVEERFYEIGSPEALAETDRHLRRSGARRGRGAGRDR